MIEHLMYRFFHLTLPRIINIVNALWIFSIFGYLHEFLTTHGQTVLFF